MAILLTRDQSSWGRKNSLDGVSGVRGPRPLGTAWWWGEPPGRLLRGSGDRKRFTRQLNPSENRKLHTKLTNERGCSWLNQAIRFKMNVWPWENFKETGKVHRYR